MKEKEELILVSPYPKSLKTNNSCTTEGAILLTFYWVDIQKTGRVYTNDALSKVKRLETHSITSLLSFNKHRDNKDMTINVMFNTWTNIATFQCKGDGSFTSSRETC